MSERIDMNPKSKFSIVVVLVLALSACGSPEAAAPTLDMNVVFTQVAETIAAEYTQTALVMPTETNTPEPTITPLPSATVQPLAVTTPTLAPPPVPTGPTALPIDATTANGCYNAYFVTDVTVPDGSKYDPGDAFTKTWRVLNTGTCDWTSDFKITYVGGNNFGSDSTKIRQRVGVGNTADISLDMYAPNRSGTAISNWQLATDAGDLFGPVLSVSVLLPGGSSTSTADDCLGSALVSESTEPAKSEFDAGVSFTKHWQIENTGTCVWTSDFRFTWVGGNVLGSDTTKIRQRVEPGGVASISLPMVVPNNSVSSSWQMADNNSVLFGQVFTFQIQVK
jgi:hypothetical protein